MEVFNMSWICEEDEWKGNGNSILSKENKRKIESVLETGAIIVQHWFYRGGRSPDCICFDNIDKFDKYIKEKTRPGDIIEVWSFQDLCNKENLIAEGKMPDSKGRVPLRGPY